MDTPGIEPRVADSIVERLRATEAEHDVTVLYACESGSRAWGFASPDSDYDVRFVYAHRRDWYVAFDVERHRDVIEPPIVDQIDCSGWDIRKALLLFTRTNGALLEWLNSPIRYVEQGVFAASLRSLAPRAMDFVALRHHYGRMARRHRSEFLLNEMVRLKRYFYVLRALFAVRHIEQGLGIPPVEFERLVDAVAPASLRDEIVALLALKRHTPELGTGEPLPALNAFIEAEFERHGETYRGSRPDRPDPQEIRSELNAIFRIAIGEL